MILSAICPQNAVLLSHRLQEHLLETRQIRHSRCDAAGVWWWCYPIGAQDRHRVLLQPDDGPDERGEARVAARRTRPVLEPPQDEMGQERSPYLRGALGFLPLIVYPFVCCGKHGLYTMAATQGNARSGTVAL